MKAPDNLTEQFKEAARKQEDTSVGFPSMDRVWSRVEARLDEDERDKQKKIIPFRKSSWKKGMAAAVLVLLGMGLAYIIGRWKSDPAPQQYVQQKPQSHEPSGLQRKANDTPVLVQAKDKPEPVSKPGVGRHKQAKHNTTTNHSPAPVVAVHTDHTKGQPGKERSVTAIAAAKPGLENEPSQVSGPRTINGQVLDLSGESAVGAAIKIKGTTTGTVTDADGRYTLQVPAGTHTLEMRSLTGETQEIDISKAKGYLVTTLERSNATLDEVQIYGRQVLRSTDVGSAGRVTSEDIAKRPVTNLNRVMEKPVAVLQPNVRYNGNAAPVTRNQADKAQDKTITIAKQSGVTSEDITRQPAPSITKALEGQVAGLQVTSGGGQPGSNALLSIRGTGSLSASSRPLIVLDGVVYSGDLTEIEPQDVVEVSVLKDATATAIYGARGANGVILIRTKSQKGLQHRSFFGRSWNKVKRLFKGKKQRYSSVVPAAMIPVAESSNGESYNPLVENPFESPSREPLSTFSIDVDNASYTNIRRMIRNGQAVPQDAVRIEEMINFFKYHYPQPADQHPFAIHTEYSYAPWNPVHKLLKIGLQGKIIPEAQLPASNLVFLVDVSGSMADANKLPLLQASMKLLTGKLRAKDKVSIVVYAGAAGLVLPPTSGNEKEKIIAALERLEAGGSTAGGEGIELAYKIARENFIPGGNNRVILATDGDFNVGSSSDADMQTLIEAERKSNVFLTCLGYGMGNYKDSKMELLADKGNGNYAYIDNIDEANRFLVKEFGGTIYSIAKDVKLQIEFNPAYVQAYRLIGYENRKLRTEDFVNDAVDAGELGSGHTVTALYEIIPAGISSRFLPAAQPPLKYTESQSAGRKGFADELATVKFRYKKPQEDKSIEMIKPIGHEPVRLASSSGDYKLAAAVAWFGLRLRSSVLVPDMNKEHILLLAAAGAGDDRDGYVAELRQLIRSAQ